MGLVNQPTPAPTRKVAATGIAGAITIVLVYIVQSLFNVEIPAEVSSAITLLISFASGYLVKEEA